MKKLIIVLGFLTGTLLYSCDNILTNEDVVIHKNIDNIEILYFSKKGDQLSFIIDNNKLVSQTYSIDTNKIWSKKYDTSGFIVDEIQYLNDTITNVITWSSAFKVNKVQKINNIKSGPAIIYYPSGDVRAKGKFIPIHADSIINFDGPVISGEPIVKTGRWDYYYTSGKVERTEFFINGIPNGVWVYYNELGEMIKQENHK